MDNQEKEQQEIGKELDPTNSEDFSEYMVKKNQKWDWTEKQEKARKSV